MPAAPLGPSGPRGPRYGSGLPPAGPAPRPPRGQRPPQRPVPIRQTVPARPRPRRTNPLSIVALALAVSGLPAAGAILGHVALGEVERSRGREDGREMALGAIWAGWSLTGLMLALGLMAMALTLVWWMAMLFAFAA